MKKIARIALLESTIKQLGYTLRYEKGNFLGGECRLKENKVVVVNRFLPMEGKIYTLAQVITRINPPGLSPEVAKIIDKLVENNLFSKRTE
ncbi:MAG: hypothetical protein K9I59_02345 [Chlorobium sp.]|uniref:hypothetical protein n=1 Tax=Chlorobium sp. TaxID=1095 RepID=UPI001D2C865E|nr:hypothetical protein [Chlorobium sp.]MBN1279215.1 hypothetical protein [Chlorobiaceae bacterium]MCF8215692.1 hypothetical protein [Chlorobium sp.]MCF8270574.1 hypothetical protein [Chlorobium sp.]MCF8286901.1 hypothetical protein [Chlorobium sp.]MCF8290497.1 hypothetical protein [Chlorobium sp.]